ncbi:MAG: hypothetical protein HC828_08695 [Blastochloris sp.]|nr:hypothetical protein [Blastochloris sp.]
MLQIISDPTAEPADKIKAQSLINDMLGLSAKYGGAEDSAEDKVNRIKKLLAEEDPEDDNE